MQQFKDRFIEASVCRLLVREPVKSQVMEQTVLSEHVGSQGRRPSERSISILIYRQSADHIAALLDLTGRTLRVFCELASLEGGLVEQDFANPLDPVSAALALCSNSGVQTVALDRRRRQP
jgi:hypothetical protein